MGQVACGERGVHGEVVVWGLLGAYSLAEVHSQIRACSELWDSKLGFGRWALLWAVNFALGGELDFWWWAQFWPVSLALGDELCFGWWARLGSVRLPFGGKLGSGWWAWLWVLSLALCCETCFVKAFCILFSFRFSFILLKSVFTLSLKNNRLKQMSIKNALCFVGWAWPYLNQLSNRINALIAS